MIKVKVRGVAGVAKSMGGTDGYQEVAVPPASTLRDLLDILVERFGPDFSRLIFRENSKELRSGMRILMNGRDFGAVGGLEASLEEGDRISFLPPLSGG
ncbi:MAG: MoaD/ThiS family protein [Firmicutes bacterium]|jgi:MoaD family protein|nr:MoaD/ThiS family protein [Bacillota bacterium]HPU01119.1 MoaD/ThiS family protein [Bacillota bacterium]